jgi:hypothetical protein
MNVRELINLLEEAADQVGSDEADIQLATQAHYPLRYHLAGVYVEEVDDPDPADDETGRIIWLVEGSQHAHGLGMGSTRGDRCARRDRHRVHLAVRQARP